MTSKVGSQEWRFMIRERSRVDGFSRRNREEQLTPAEGTIRLAQVMVEQMGCHPQLTDISVKLGELRDLLADYIDATEEERRIWARELMSP